MALARIKKSWINVTALLCAMSAHVSVMAQYDTHEKRAKFFLDITKKYDPDAFEILKADKPDEFLVYANDYQTAKELLGRYGTVVHESCHGYNFKIGVAGGWKFNGYFVTGDCKIAAKQESFFPSSRLNSMVPEEQQKKIFRYSTYVSGRSENSSSLQGVYGFIDEFSAYYHGTKAELALLQYYESVCPYTDAHCWIDQYLSKMQSTLYAYYEFRLFIAWYLIYAEQHEQKIFAELINNQNLRLAFTLIDIQFKSLVDDYFTTRSKLIDRLNAAGSKIVLKEKFIRIIEGNSSTGTGIPDDNIAYLKSLFTEQENKMLEKFSVKGATLSNYKKFLKKAYQK